MSGALRVCKKMQLNPSKTKNQKMQVSRAMSGSSLSSCTLVAEINGVKDSIKFKSIVSMAGNQAG